MSESSSLHLTDAEITRAFADSKWAEAYPPILNVDQAAQLMGVPNTTALTDLVSPWPFRRNCGFDNP
jgi:hypothetical protein